MTQLNRPLEKLLRIKSWITIFWTMMNVSWSLMTKKIIVMDYQPVWWIVNDKYLHNNDFVMKFVSRPKFHPGIWSVTIISVTTRNVVVPNWWVFVMSKWTRTLWMVTKLRLLAVTTTTTIRIKCHSIYTTFMPLPVGRVGIPNVTIIHHTAQWICVPYGWLWKRWLVSIIVHVGLDCPMSVPMNY